MKSQWIVKFKCSGDYLSEIKLDSEAGIRYVLSAKQVGAFRFGDRQDAAEVARLVWGTVIKIC